MSQSRGGATKRMLLEGVGKLPSLFRHHSRAIKRQAAKHHNSTFVLVAIALTISIILSSANVSNTFAAAYNWNQTDWSGGLDGGAYPSHPSNQSGWTNYSAKDSDLSTAGGSLTLGSTAGSASQTSASDWSAGTHSQTVASGSGDDATVGLGSSDTYEAGSWVEPSVPNLTDQVHVPQTYIAADKEIYTYFSTGLTKYNVETRVMTALASPPQGAGGQYSAILYPGSGDLIYLKRGGTNVGTPYTDFYSYSISGNSYTTLTSTPAGFLYGLVYPGSGDLMYALISSTFYSYSISGNSWSSAPANPPSSFNSTVLTTDGTYVYALAGNNTTTFYRYNIGGNSWSSMTAIPAGADREAALAYDGGNYIYAFRGNGSTDFYRYSISGNSWSTLSATPGVVDNDRWTTLHYIAATDSVYLYKPKNGGRLGVWEYKVATDSWLTLKEPTLSFGTHSSVVDTRTGELYVLNYYPSGGASGFSRYSFDTNTWTSLTMTPTVNTASHLVYPGSGDYLYAMGTSTNRFYRYSITDNSWDTLATAPLSAGTGGSMVAPDGTDHIYMIGGSTSYYRYTISTNTWSSSLGTLPGSTSNGRLVYPGSGDYMYMFRDGSTYAARYSLSGGTWSDITASPVTLSAASAIAPGNGHIYLNTGNTTAKFYDYSIAGNSWDELSDAPVVSTTSGSYGYHKLAYPGSGNLLYLTVAGTGTMYRYAFTSSGYYTSGDFTSSAINIASAPAYSTLAWNGTVPAQTELKFRIRSADSSEGLASATYYGPTSTSDYYSSSGTAINSVHDGDAWVQVKAFLTTADAGSTSTLADFTVNYETYATDATLTSSAFNSGVAVNQLNTIQWSESLPSGTDAVFQIRSAPDDGGEPGTFTSWLGPDGTSSTYFTDSTGGEELPEALTDDTDDQWFQYKVFLSSSSGALTPEVTDVTLAYEFNFAPDFSSSYPADGGTGVGAAMNSNGTVTISYSVRDVDSTGGSATPGYVTPSFEYSLNGGSSWASISSTYLAATDLDNKSVDESSYTVHTATWNAKAQAPDNYTADAQVRVTVNDNEAYANSDTAVSAEFTLDTKAPVAASPAIVINSGDATTTSPNVTLTINASDDSSLEMIISESSSFTGASYVPYAATKAITLSSGDSVKTVYINFRDYYGNISGVQSDAITLNAIAPATPGGVTIKDTSTYSTNAFQIQLGWQKNVESDFASYRVFRSIDGGDYSLVSTINDININYFVDNDVTTFKDYSYKLTAVDEVGNSSDFSSVVSIELTPIVEFRQTPPPLQISNGPVITSVTSSPKAESATIGWQTNVDSTSLVKYSIDYSLANEAKSDKPTISHEVELTNLIPETTYLYTVTACNIDNACTETELLEFRTLAKDGGVGATGDDPSGGGDSVGSDSPEGLLGDVIQSLVLASKFLSDNVPTAVPAAVGFLTLVPAITLLPLSSGISVAMTSGAPAFQYLFFSLWPAFRPLRRWGTVRDKNTNVPLPGIFVELVNSTDGTLIKKVLTDKTGRFGFLSGIEGQFRVEVKNPLYRPFSTQEMSAESFRDKAITFDILLEPIEEVRAKSLQRISRYVNLAVIIQFIQLVLLVLGTLVAVAFIVSAQTTENVLLVLLYVLLWVLRLVGVRSYRQSGFIRSGVTNQPLDKAVVQVTAIKRGVQEFIHSAITSADGRFLIIVPRNRYNVIAAKEGYEPGQKQIAGEVEGVDIRLEASSDQSERS